MSSIKHPKTLGQVPPAILEKALSETLRCFNNGLKRRRAGSNVENSGTVTVVDGAGNTTSQISIPIDANTNLFLRLTKRV